MVAEDLRATVDEPIEGLMADDQRAVFNARVDPRTTATVGSSLRLAVDPGQFHFFDPENGGTLRTPPAVAPSTKPHT